MRPLLVCLAGLLVCSPALARDIPKDASLKELVELLKDGKEGARKGACKRLGERADKDTVPAMAEVILKDASVRVKLECLQALRKIGPNPSSAVAVRAAALKDPEKKVRAEAVETVPYVDPDIGGEVAMEVLAKEKELAVRKEACEAIEKKGWKVADATVMALVSDAAQPVELRRACLQAVVAIGSDAGYALAYKTMLSDPDENMRRQASAEIEHKPRADSLDPLCQALKDKNARVASNAAKGLKNLGNKAGAACLREAAKAAASGRLAAEMNKIADALEK